MVADGVSAWMVTKGIDAGKYAKQLIFNAESLNDHDHAMGTDQMLVQAIEEDHQQGSSTAVVAKLQEDGKLQTTNLGDSGYMIFRPNDNSLTQVFKSQEQQHYWNCPFQVGSDSKKDEDLAYSTTHQLREDDILVMGSDGLFDNEYDEEIKDCLLVNLVQKKIEAPQAASDCIAKQAEVHGKDRWFFSPFSYHDCQAHENLSQIDAQMKRTRCALGGKQDDISVIVTQVSHK